MKTALLGLGVLAALLLPGSAFGGEAFERALALAGEERFAEARDVLGPVLEHEPVDAQARLLHGVLRAHEGRVGEAIEIFEALRNEHPDMLEPYNNLAVLYALTGRLEAARDTLLVTLEWRPDAVVYANLGDVYTKLARRAYEHARELEAGGGARTDQELDTAFAMPATPEGSSESAPRRDATQQPVMVPPGDAPDPAAPPVEPGAATTKPAEVESEAVKPAAVKPAVPAAPEQESATGTQDAAPEPGGSAPGQESATGTQDAAPESGGSASGQESATGTQDAAPESGGSAPGQAPATPESPDAAAAEAVPAGSEPASTPSAFCARAGGFDGRGDVAEAARWLQSHGAEVLEVRHEERRVTDGYRVYLPPLQTRDEAVAKLREIRNSGVRDVAVIPDGDLANGISFGIYRKAENMNRRVAALDRLGYAVRSQPTELEPVGEYVVEARAGGAPATLDAAWTSRFPGQALRVVDCR